MIDVYIKEYSEYSIYFLNSEFSLWKYEEIKKSEREIFVVLREMNLTKAVLTSVAARAAAHATRAAEGAVPARIAHGITVYNKIYNNAKKEFEETGEIKGYEIYLVSLNKKIWAGKEDWEFLKGTFNV